MGEQEKQFREIADELPVMLWAAGAGRRVTFFNRLWLRFTGRALEKGLASTWIRDVHPADRARCDTVFKTAMGRRQTFQVECRMRRADGRYRWMLASGAPQFSNEGTFAGYVGTCTDITPIRSPHGPAQDESHLTALVAAGVAHDFNNLLGSILANVELALAGTPGPSCREDLGRIRTVAVRASEVARELMVYAGQDQASSTAVDVSELVEEMINLLQASIPKQTRLVTDLASDLPAVLANATELRQVVMNLILNASEAVGPAGGQIHVTTSHTTVGPANAFAELRPGECVRLEVGDTGHGMTPEVQERIAHPHFTTKPAGRGLGLTVVRRIVRTCGGAIQYHSAPGEGSRFVILLPAAAGTAFDHAPAAQGASMIAPEPGFGLLIVEDEESLRVPVANVLRRRGLLVMEAADGPAALEILRGHREAIEAILLDLTLPGMSSTNVIAEAGRIRPDVSIVLTSGYSRRTAARALAKPQVKGFLRKPYCIDELVRTLVQAVADSAPAFTYSIGNC